MTRREGTRGWVIAVAAVFIAMSGVTGAAPAQSATIIKQQAKAQFAGKSATSHHVWTIDGGKFHLTVTGDNGQTDYVFNGRNFYICGKFSKEDLAYLQSHKIESSKLADRFKAGVCQAVPSNFLIRFFLAQSSAAEALDRTDGMLLTLAMENYEAKASGKPTTVAGQNCSGFTRRYALQKNAGAGVSARVTVEDTLCLANSLEWRGGLWSEIKKSLMRQPQGRSLLAKLALERDKLQGFPLQFESNLAIVDTAGKTHTSTISLQTSSVSTEKAKPDAFKIPAGYAIISPENMESLEREQGSKPLAQDKAEPPSMYGIPSVLLCAIAGTLGCLWGN